MYRNRWLAGLAGAVLIQGCPTPDQNDDEVVPLEITAREASLTANANIEAHLTELAATIKVLKESELFDDAFPAGDRAPCAPGDTDCENAPAESPLDFDEEVDELTDWLRDNVFAESLVESSTATSVTFRLSAEKLCPESTDSTGLVSRNPECVRLYTTLPFRLTVTSLAENDVDVRLDIGTSHPTDIQLHRGLVGAIVDLAEVKKAANLIANVNGDSLEGFPSTFEGKVQVELVRSATQEYTASLSLLSAVRIGDKPADDRDHYLVALAPAARALSAKLSATSKNVIGSVDFKAIDLALALDLLAGSGSTETCSVSPNGEEDCTVEESDPLTGVVAGHLAGLSASSTFAIANDTLTVSNVGLGDATSTVKYGANTILSFDLNKDNGRRFGFTANYADGKSTVEVTPAFVARVAHDFRSLQSQLEDLPSWALNGFAEVKLDGAAAPKIEFLDFGGGSSASPTPEPPPCEPGQDCSGGDSGGDGGSGGEPPPGDGEPVEPSEPTRFARLIAGQLTLSASGIQPVVIGAPQCVIEAEIPDGTELTHPFEAVTSGVCE